MKKCELCKSQARIYCESDQASLCWTCDARVHSANFLVARHSRSILCHLCRNPTPWTASGEKLGRTVSICERCVCAHRDNHDDDEEEEIDTDGEYEEEEEIDDDDDDGRIEVENNEEGDNQVVPWSSSKSPPPAASSSISEECSSRFCNGGGEVSSKRMDVADLHSNV